MGQTLLEVAILIVFFSIGTMLIGNPRSYLAKLGRPATDKHIRATRLIGAGFLMLVLMALVQWFRSSR
ncbi:MAG: hypothetical protein WA651_05885 [Candidatus Sulfotelmatobacter sp.]